MNGIKNRRNNYSKIWYNLEENNGIGGNPWSQSCGKIKVHGGKDLWNSWVLSRQWKIEGLMDVESGETTEVEDVTGIWRGDSRDRLRWDWWSEAGWMSWYHWCDTTVRVSSSLWSILKSNRALWALGNVPSTDMPRPPGFNRVCQQQLRILNVLYCSR